MPEDNISHIDFDELDRKAISKPLISHMFTRRIHLRMFLMEKFLFIRPTILIRASPLMTWAVISQWKIITYFSLDNIGGADNRSWCCPACKRCTLGGKTNVGSRCSL